MIGVSTGGKEENDSIVMEYEEEGEVYYVYPTSVSVLLPPLPSSFCKNTASIKLFDDQNVPYIRENSLKYHFNSLRGRMVARVKGAWDSCSTCVKMIVRGQRELFMTGTRKSGSVFVFMIFFE